tara:strand:- start:651 stop:2381 length:1731 start_codon:yes stop_codon:yes gene_type:complete
MFASEYRALVGKVMTEKRGVGVSRLFAHVAACTVALALCLTSFSADAANRKRKAFVPTSASLVMDAYSGRVLYSSNADTQCYPASLTKVMTLYLLFEKLEQGKVTLNTKLKVSHHAAAQAPSRLGLKPGETIRVEDAILALVTKSANDIAVVVAEYIGDTEGDFAELMTAKAKKIGMSRTRYMNASGLPNRSQLTTARDQATLAHRIQIDFPQYYGYFSTKTFAWDGRVFKNHNHLLGKYDGINGLKTGYTAASGFNLTTTVKRDGKSVIGVVLGGKTARARDLQMVAILDRTMPKAVAQRDTGTRIASAIPTGPAPTPITKPDNDALNALVASVDEPDPDEEAYTGTDQVASMSARPALRPVVSELPEVKQEVKQVAALKTTAPVAQNLAAAVATPAGKTAAPLDQATAYALAALGKAEGPVRQAGRDIGSLIITPANASEGKQATAASPTVTLRTSVNDSSINSPTRGWTVKDPLIPEGSWVIQIGAYSDQGDAVSRIRDAIKAAPKELASAVPVTIPVQSTDNRTLYRSRFGGFEDEKEARNACGRLARQKISCIAIPPANWAMPVSGGKARG